MQVQRYKIVYNQAWLTGGIGTIGGDVDLVAIDCTTQVNELVLGIFREKPLKAFSCVVLRSDCGNLNHGFF